MLEYYRFKSVYDLFLKGQFEEARSELSELQHRYVDLCQENQNLKTQVQEYEDVLYLARNLVFDGSFFWLITGSIKQGPFCPNCYNKDGILTRITDIYPRRCASCGEVYERSGALGKARQEQAMQRVMEQAAALGAIRAFAGSDAHVEGSPAEAAPAQIEHRAKIIPFPKQA